MFSTSVMRSKPITRRTILSQRDRLPEAARRAASDAIADATDVLLSSLAAGSIVALYAPKGTEVETARLDALARSRGLRVVYPRVVDGDRRLAFHEVSQDQLVPARYGLSEPRAEAPRVATSQIAAFVIPGLAFDRDGWRVGWGKGYYDATLATAPQARRIGLSFECQLVDEVPRDVHDARLHYVVTEANVYQGALD